VGYGASKDSGSYAMSKVITLQEHDVSPETMDADLIEMLEELLERTKAGSIKSVAVALVREDGNLGTRWAGASSSIPMAAAISRLQFDYMTGWHGAQ
jgi:hypothetical protein